MDRIKKVKKQTENEQQEENFTHHNDSKFSICVMLLGYKNFESRYNV